MSNTYIAATSRQAHAFDINHQRRRDIAKLVVQRHGSLAKAPADLRKKYAIAAAWHCPDDSERRFLMVKWHREAGTPALRSTMDRIDAILEKNPARRIKADTLAKYLHISDAERTALKITTIGAHDVPKAERQKRRKEKRRLADKARRRALGAKAHELSICQTKPWIAAGFRCRRTWERHGKPVAAPRHNCRKYLLYILASNLRHPAEELPRMGPSPEDSLGALAARQGSRQQARPL
jgi:hypothetical protein